MMDAELVALASSGAGTLVTLMVTESWNEVKEKVAEVFGRRPGGAATVAGELDRSRADVVAARERGDVLAVADVAAQWSARLRQMLQEDPEAGPALAALLAPYLSAGGPGVAHTDIHDNEFRGPAPINTGPGFQINTFPSTAP